MNRPMKHTCFYIIHYKILCFANMCFEVLEEAEEYCEKLGINNED